MLLMPGWATLICSAMATMAAATISTSTQASRKPPDLENDRARIGEDHLADDEQDQNVDEAGYVPERARPAAAGRIRLAHHGRLHMGCIRHRIPLDRVRHPGAGQSTTPEADQHY
jgi:hypothetical protein